MIWKNRNKNLRKTNARCTATPTKVWRPSGQCYGSTPPGSICHYLQNREQPPSRATVNRILTQVSNLLELFSSDPLVHQDAPACTSVYQTENALHVVLEVSDGTVLHQDVALDLTISPFEAPTYSSVDNLLKNKVLSI